MSGIFFALRIGASTVYCRKPDLKGHEDESRLPKETPQLNYRVNNNSLYLVNVQISSSTKSSNLSQCSLITSK